MHPYKKIGKEDIEYFIKAIGHDNVFTDHEILNEYAHDETEDLNYQPEVVLKPHNAEQISSILRYCNEQHIPVTPRAGGTGLSGGALPVYGGVSLSVELLDTLIQVDERNLQATVESGMITQHFMDEVMSHQLLYPVDPSSKGSCMLAGNLAESSGGPRAVKYGTVRDYVLNMEVVLPSGDIIWTGANTLKYASGYNLTHLMIGSEGTLGIITKIVFKLIPLPTQNLLLLASFVSASKACEAVSAIFKNGIIPSALEFMERDAVDWVTEYENITFHQKENINAYLLIEVDGNDMDILFKECEKITEVLYQYQV